MSGCDTTSRFFGIGKVKLIQNTILDDDQERSSLFESASNDAAEIVEADEKISYMVNINARH